MVAALRGRLEANKHRAKRELLNAYNTGAFAGAASVGKLKSFDEYVPKDSSEQTRVENAKAIHFFHTLKARGLDVQITRTVN